MGEIETTAEPVESVAEAVTENDELIKLVQVPIIVERLETIRNEILMQTDEALSMECNEYTYKIVKEMRSDLNKKFNLLEEQRKQLKKQLLEPYEVFEKIYRACVTDVFKPAEKQLADKINAVTDGLKDQKREKAVSYFNECVNAKGIDFLTFERLNLTIGMNTSDKSLKKAISEFVDKVAEALEMINTQEYAAEILVEYKKTLNANQAILTINNRHKAIAEEMERQEKLKAIEESRKAQAAKVEEAIIEEFEETAETESFFSAPATIETPEEVPEAEQDEAPATPQEINDDTIVQVKFEIRKIRLGALKKIVQIMREDGADYEQF